MFVCNYSLNATEASNTDDRLNWRSCLILSYPYYFLHILVRQPGVVASLLRLLGGLCFTAHAPRNGSGLYGFASRVNGGQWSTRTYYIGIRPCAGFHVLACDADFLFTEV
jgi:hypothetical protein